MKDCKITTLRIGIRAQDIQTGLQDIQTGAFDVETETIRLVGMAERLAIHIRGTDVITDYRKLRYIGSQFGIEPLVLPRVLDVLQELGWTTVVKKGDKIQKVEERVPYFSDIYTLAGEYFTDQNPSEIERATIEIADRLALNPVTEREVERTYGLKTSDLQMVLDIGRSGKIINEYHSKSVGDTVLYSPLYWSENPQMLESMFSLLKQYGADKVYSALSKVRDYQGRPLTDDFLKDNYELLDEEMKIITEAVKRGIILAPAVESTMGRKNFAFVPFIGLPLEEKVTLEKAMAVLACVRYGQHFGFITRIKYPEIILDKLLSSPHRIGSHTEIRRQYAILVGRGIGKVYPDSSQKGRYYFELIQTPENIKAVKVARDLLKVGELLEDRGLSKKLRDLLFNGGRYEESLRTLPKLKTAAYMSQQTQENIMDVLNDTMDKVWGG